MIRFARSNTLTGIVRPICLAAYEESIPPFCSSRSTKGTRGLMLMSLT